MQMAVSSDRIYNSQAVKRKGRKCCCCGGNGQPAPKIRNEGEMKRPVNSEGKTKPFNCIIIQVDSGFVTVPGPPSSILHGQIT
ncbi:Hypothetical protein NTJ_11053 [Nesidiocoris tenuis]|uniref:Uncharacterized protein n=1 Tax=Nesidiocoris tenuis TaxID=355587 RepID=A0ABN7B1X5_9HEMI|nr:Hypothetical protein NTJ_11053 [Nesidiocoris tenuis]